MSDWTEVKISVDAENVDKAGDIASMVVPYGIYIEDYRDLEKQAWEIAHIDLIDEELLQKDRTKAIVHVYISPEENPHEAVAFLRERYSAEGINSEIVLNQCKKQLKSGIGLRGLGGQDPAGAYATEGFDMFELMVNSIKEEFVKFCYNVTVQTSAERKNVLGSGQSRKDEFVDDTPAAGGQQMPQQTQIPERERKKPDPVKREAPKVGRNDPCPCGSGKKYKHCCGRMTPGEQ